MRSGIAPDYLLENPDFTEQLLCVLEDLHDDDEDGK